MNTPRPSRAIFLLPSSADNPCLSTIVRAKSDDQSGKIIITNLAAYLYKGIIIMGRELIWSENTILSKLAIIQAFIYKYVFLSEIPNRGISYYHDGVRGYS